MQPTARNRSFAHDFLRIFFDAALPQSAF